MLRTQSRRQGLRLFYLVLKRSGAWRVLSAFGILYLVCALVVLIWEPGVSTYGDALWFLWAVSTTVGLGDLTAVTTCGRLATIICSFAAIGATAIVTALIVDFFNERRQSMVDEALTAQLDKLEHLSELSKQELDEISAWVRRLRS